MNKVDTIKKSKITTRSYKMKNMNMTKGVDTSSIKNILLSTNVDDTTNVDDIGGRIKNIIAKQLGIGEANSIDNNATFNNDLGADSLDAVEFVIAVEEEFNINIPDEDAERITTVQQLIDYVQSRI